MKISTDENKTKTNRWQIDNKIHERESILKREEIFKNYNMQIWIRFLHNLPLPAITNNQMKIFIKIQFFSYNHK